MINKIKLAKKPTPIYKLERLSEIYNKPIYVKRDDFDGLECSGNKIRKLEYSLFEAEKLGCNAVITMGAIQSNHARATAAACAKLGLECHLILRGVEAEFEGNLFLDAILGANIHIIPPESSREEKAEQVAEELKKQGKKPYLIPVGASNAVGSLGYAESFDEILEFEKESGIEFDTVCVSVGSGGTYSGLWFANSKLEKKKRILGFAVCDDCETFTRDITNIVRDMGAKEFSGIEINDSYIGRGYALAQKQEIKDYYDIARIEGLVLDPCYTGKGFRGMLNEIKNGSLKEAKNILFIHTGGLFGWTKEHRSMLKEILENKI